MSIGRRTHEAMDAELCGSPVELSEGRATVSMRCTPRMAADGSGLVHGGFTFGLADHAAMLAINEPTVVLGSAETRFLAPTRVGDEVVAKARVSEEQGSKRFVDVQCLCGERTVFEGRFTCFVPKHHVLGGSPPESPSSNEQE